MKKLLLLSVIMLSAFSSNAVAQNYQAAVDTVWGKNYSAEVDGHAAPACSDSHEILTPYPTTPDDAVGNLHLCYYVHIPEGHVKADLVLRNRRSVAQLHLVLTRPDTGDTLLVNDVAGTRPNAMDTLALVPDMVFPEDTWYRLELSGDNARSQISKIDYWLFRRESPKACTTARIQSALASYLGEFKSNLPKAPTSDGYEWCYTEVMMPADMEQINTYYSVMNFLGGYLGFQTPRGNTTKWYEDFYHNVLFSMWDNGDTDKDATLPEYLKSCSLDASDDVNCRRFGGEGTGCQAFLEYGEGDNWWRPGEWIQVLTCARPEDVTVITTNEDGTTETFTYNYTMVTMWYKMANDNQWYYVATHRKSAVSNFFDGWGAFIENWAPDNGAFPRRCYFRNSFMKATGSCQWYPCNTCHTGYYYDPSRLRPDQRDRRLDFSHGVSEEYDNCFWMETGGYTVVNDGINHWLTVPATTDYTPVDTINLDNLWKKVEKAIVNGGRDKVFSKMSAYANQRTIMNLTATAISYWQSYGLKQVEYDNLRRMYNNGAPNVSFDAIFTMLLNYGQAIIRRGYNDVITANIKPTLSLEGLLAVAKDIIDSENDLDGYRTEDLSLLKSVYADSTCTDASLMFETLVNVAENSSPLIYRDVKKMLHIGGAHAYVLSSPNGYGTLKVRDSKLAVDGATINTAIDANKGKVNYADNSVCWLILHEDGEDDYYVYNIAEGKFLDISGTEPTLSELPTPLTLSISGTNFYFSKNGKYLGLNPVSDEPARLLSNMNNAVYFKLIDNITMQPTRVFSDQVRQMIRDQKQFVHNVVSLGNMLNVPEGCVGYITDPAKRAELEELYNGGDVSLDKASEIAAALSGKGYYIEFQPTNKAYRFHTCNPARSTTPEMRLNDGLTLKTEELNNIAAQIWVLESAEGGYIINCQGKAFGAIQEYNKSGVRCVDKSKAVAACLFNRGGFRYTLSAQEGSLYALGASGVTCMTGNIDDVTSQWWLEEANDYEVTTNAAGLAAAYFDFDVVVPYGLSAYIVKSVDADGVATAEGISSPTIPAGTPVLLKGEAVTTYTLAVASYGNGKEGENLLLGTYLKNKSMTANDYYVIAPEGEEPAMTLGTSTTLEANKVYLPKSAVVGEVERITFTFTTPTGIDNVEADEVGDDNAPRYNISGQRVSKDAKGIIIQKGKKVIQ